MTRDRDTAYDDRMSEDEDRRAREFYYRSGYSRRGTPWEDAAPAIRDVCLLIATSEAQIAADRYQRPSIWRHYLDEHPILLLFGSMLLVVLVAVILALTVE